MPKDKCRSNYEIKSSPFRNLDKPVTTHQWILKLVDEVLMGNSILS
jgi:hypothetical protein